MTKQNLIDILRGFDQNLNGAQFHSINPPSLSGVSNAFILAAELEADGTPLDRRIDYEVEIRFRGNMPNGGFFDKSNPLESKNNRLTSIEDVKACIIRSVGEILNFDVSFSKDEFSQPIAIASFPSEL